MIVLLFMMFFAICCGIIANNKNRSVGLAIFCGAFFGIFAPVLFLYLNNN